MSRKKNVGNKQMKEFVAESLRLYSAIQDVLETHGDEDSINVDGWPKMVTASIAMKSFWERAVGGMTLSSIDLEQFMQVREVAPVDYSLVAEKPPKTASKAKKKSGP